VDLILQQVYSAQPAGLLPVPKAASQPVPKAVSRPVSKAVQQPITAFFKVPLPKVRRPSQVEQMATASQSAGDLLEGGVPNSMKGGNFDSLGQVRRNIGGRPKMEDADKRGAPSGARGGNNLKPGQEKLKTEPGAIQANVIHCCFGPH